MTTSTGTGSLPAEIATRYTRPVALRHERLYGHGYQGPGQPEVFDALCARLDLRPGMRVLDAGSGLGGDTFRLARAHGVTVVGLDAAPDMTALCRERIPAEGSAATTFETGDLRTSPVLAPESFDVVWTRDCGAFLPPPEKAAVWRRFHRTLRPGGQVLVTDYCLGPSPSSPEFSARMAAWGQHMITFDQYAEVLRAAGFVDITTEDRSQDLMDSMLEGRRHLIEDRAEFLAELSEEEYDGLLDRWDKKIHSCGGGELAWLVLTARRSPASAS